MQYLKLQQAFRQTDAWGEADCCARGAWVSIAGYCADKENGGRIEGAKAWGDRLWSQRAGVTVTQVEVAVLARLASWDGDDLVVAGYDTKGETTCLQNRALAKLGGLASGKSRSAASARRFQGSTGHEATGEANASGECFTESEARGEAPAEANAPAKPEPNIQYPVSSDQDSNDDDPTRAHPRDPRIAVVVALGAAMVDKDGKDLTARWVNSMGNATIAECEAVMRCAPRILGHELRYQGLFQRVLKRVREAAAAERAAERAEARQDAEREQRVVAVAVAKRIDAFLATADGKALDLRINGIARDALLSLREGKLDSLRLLVDRFPDLKRVANEAAAAVVA
jgi:hypothetical protein